MDINKNERFNKANCEKDLNTMKETYLINPDDLKEKYRYARLLIKNGEREKGKKLLTELLKTSYKNYALFELGRVVMFEKDLSKAKSIFNKLLKTDNRNYSLFQLGKISVIERNYEEAKKYFRMLLDTESKDYALFELANVFYLEKNIEEARNYFVSLIETNSKSKDYAVRSIILLEIKENNLEEALKYINYALKNGIEVKNNVILYVSKELDVFFDSRYYKYSDYHLNFEEQQIINYNQYEVISHMIDREEEKTGNKAKFNFNIDIYELFFEIKKYLIDEYKIHDFSFNDVYVIPYKNVGLNGEEYLRVITLPNGNILSIHPLDNKYVDERDDDYYNTGELRVRK